METFLHKPIHMTYQGKNLFGNITVTINGDSTAVDNGDGTTTYTQDATLSIVTKNPDIVAQKIAEILQTVDPDQALQALQALPPADNTPQ